MVQGRHCCRLFLLPEHLSHNKLLITITSTCILLQYNGANIQLLDLPGIIEGASQGEINSIG